MDGETSYESDLSESWSLIDINLNEESLSVAEGPAESEHSSLPVSKNEKIRVDKTKLEDFLRNCKEATETDFSHVSDSESDMSLKNGELPSKNETEQDQIDILNEKSDYVEKLDSGDAESIEILDMDGSCPDSEVERLDISHFEHLNFSTYQSGDDESSEGNRSGESRSNNSAVIKRRRRRSNKSSEEPVNSVNSENSPRSPVENRISSKERQNLIEKSSSCHPVYKHCRNNVANTILSLSVGVIFAGVACIAIGHFLGVQDAAQTAVELVETLKKLEVENAALQSHLSHLNKALLSREANSKSDNLLEEAQSEVFYQETPDDESSSGRETNLKKAVLTDVRSTLNPIKLLSQLDDFIRKNKKATDTEYGIDFNGFGKSIHDQLNSLRIMQESGAKILEGTDKKILKELQTIVSKLSSSQKHIENLNEKVIKLKDIVDRIERNIPDSLGKLKSKGSKHKRKVPVTELDLQTMENEIPDQTYQESIAVFEFPKPESFYKKEKNGENDFERTNSTTAFPKDDSEKKEKVKQINKRHKKENKRKEEKKHSKDKWKNRKFKDKKSKEKRDATERKHIGSKIYKVLKTLKKRGSHEKNKQKLSEFRHDPSEFNTTIFQNKKHAKRFEKPKSKKVKKWKLKKLLSSNLEKEPHIKTNEFSPALSGSDLFNVTGYWVFKWAGGREEIRKHQSLSDWQFERAKARKEQRDDECTENWQFKRALARENNRQDVRWPRGKYLKNAGKEFFHDGFSWM